MPKFSSRRIRRFWRLFRRKKPVLIDLNYSYQHLLRFPRLPITVPPLVPTLMSYRWNDDDDDDDDCQTIPKKFSRDHHYQPHVRRRIPKRFSDIVGPSSHHYHNRKPSADRAESFLREKPPRRPSHPDLSANYHEKKLRERISSMSRIDDKKCPSPKYRSRNNIDLLAQRMQAAMSTELMHSLDRNFVFSERKNSSKRINRSQSFNCYYEESTIISMENPQRIPRVKLISEEELTSPSHDEPTPDYDDNDDDNDDQSLPLPLSLPPPLPLLPLDDTDEEPMIDYDDSNDATTPVPTSPLENLGVSASFILPESSSPEQNSVPPTPPPLPNLNFNRNEKKPTVRCRTIAEEINTDHRLTLKDEIETKISTMVSQPSASASPPPPPPPSVTTGPLVPLTTATNKSAYMPISKELLSKTTLRKVSHPVSRSFSSYGSMSQINERETELTTIRERTSQIDEASFDISLSSTNTSVMSEHKSSSKIYNDYKRRASLISVPQSGRNSRSTIVHPMHTHIGLRSTTSSSSLKDLSNERTLTNKQMNLCVINQLNEHLSSKLRQQTNETSVTIDHVNEDITEAITVNVYDEPNHDQTRTNLNLPDFSNSSVPPPPPPLPVGGFRPVHPYVSISQRASIVTLPPIGSDGGCTTGTSTISSKLSDTRILRELRSNPLFTKAKEHLEIEPGSHGRRSGRRLMDGQSNNESDPSYLRLNHCAKVNVTRKVESFILNADELKTVLGHTLAKRSQSMNNPKRKSSLVTNPCRQSELEMIFQKRAQRLEQKLT